MSIYLDRYIRQIVESKKSKSTPINDKDGKEIGSYWKTGDKNWPIGYRHHETGMSWQGDTPEEAIEHVNDHHQSYLNSNLFKKRKLKEETQKETIEEADKKVTWVADNDGNDIGYIEKHQGRYKDYYHAKDKKGKLISVHKHHGDAYNAVEVNHASSK